MKNILIFFTLIIFHLPDLKAEITNKLILSNAF